jgi:hypothetical protein
MKDNPLLTFKKGFSGIDIPNVKLLQTSGLSSERVPNGVFKCASLGANDLNEEIISVSK